MGTLSIHPAPQHVLRPDACTIRGAAEDALRLLPSRCQDGESLLRERLISRHVPTEMCKICGYVAPQ
jgi:hypothetical protein